MISRVADGCFWLTRYLERVDTLARLLDVHHALHIDAGLPEDRSWRPVLDVTDELAAFDARAPGAAEDTGEAVQHYLVWDADHLSSIFNAVRGTRENARSVREIMSLEAWEAVNDLWLWLKDDAARDLYHTNRSAFYERLMQGAVLFHGVSHATMLHDEPFAFMKLGRAVERASQTARILAAHSRFEAPVPGSSLDAACSLALLRSCCGFDPFFRGHARPLRGDEVRRFLLFERTFPRSVLHNLDEARSLLYALRRDDPLGLPRRSRSALERLRGEVLQMDYRDVEERGVYETARWTVEATDLLCDAIHEDYLDPPHRWLVHCVRVLESVSEEPPQRAA